MDGRFSYRYLLPLRTGDASELLQVGDKRMYLGFVQVGKRRHVLPAIVESLQQGRVGLLRKLRCVRAADVHTDRLHSLHDQPHGSRPDWVDDGINFRWSALAR